MNKRMLIAAQIGAFVIVATVIKLSLDKVNKESRKAEEKSLNQVNNIVNDCINDMKKSAETEFEKRI